MNIVEGLSVCIDCIKQNIGNFLLLPLLLAIASSSQISSLRVIKTAAGRFARPKRTGERASERARPLRRIKMIDDEVAAAIEIEQVSPLPKSAWICPV